MNRNLVERGPSATDHLWNQIRLRWSRGESAYSISNSLGGHPTRQAIAKRARERGWSREVDGLVSDKHLRKHPIALGKDSPETRERILELLRNGATLKLAAGAMGISPDTLLRWRKEDPLFAAQCHAARHQMLADCSHTLYASAQRDWKAAKHVLAVAPETRGEFSESRTHEPIEVIIHIDRSGGDRAKSVIIDQPAHLLEEEG